MIILIVLAGLCAWGVVAAILAASSDSPRRMPTVSGYDTRRPLL